MLEELPLTMEGILQVPPALKQLFVLDPMLLFGPAGCSAPTDPSLFLSTPTQFCISVCHCNPVLPPTRYYPASARAVRQRKELSSLVFSCQCTTRAATTPIADISQGRLAICLCVSNASSPVCLMTTSGCA